MKYKSNLLFFVLAILAIPRLYGAETMTVKGSVLTAPTNIFVPGSVTISNSLTVRVNSSNGTPVTIYLPANAYSNALQIFDVSSNLVASISSTGLFVRGTITATNLQVASGGGAAGYFYSPDGTNSYWTNVVVGSGGLTNGYSFDTFQFGVNNATNIALASGSRQTNSVFFSSARLANGASLTLTNGNITVKSNGIVTIGDGLGTASLRFEVGSYASDSTGSEQWNFKTVAAGGSDGSTVARLSDLTNGVVVASSNGQVTNLTDVGWIKIQGNQTNSLSIYITQDAIISGAVDANSLRVAGFITNSSLTAGSLLQADANKRITSVSQSSGSLPIGTSGGVFSSATLTPINGVQIINGSGAISIGLGSSGSTTNLALYPNGTSGSSAVSLSIFSIPGSVTDEMRWMGTNGSLIKASFDSNQLFNVFAPVTIWGSTTANTNLFLGTNFQGSVGDVLTLGANGIFLGTPTVGGGANTFNANQFDSSGIIDLLSGALLTNIVHQGALASRGSITNSLQADFGGPVTNWNTVRNKSGVTNDANTQTTGAATNVSTLDVAGALNTFAPSTNWNTVRNKSGVTNDANTLTAGAATNVSTLDVAGSLNTFSPSTNWSTVRHKANVTNDTVLHQVGVQTNVSSLDVAGALNTFAPSTNWNTIRNKASVTNDSIVHTVGASTNVSSLDVAGSLNTFAASTNWNTVRNKAGVTNDANTLTTGAATNVSSLDVAGALNTFAASTNWNTVRNKANVTNDAILHVAGNQTNAATLDVAGPFIAHFAATNRSTLRVMGAQTNDTTLRVVGNLTLDGPVSYSWSTVSASDIDWAGGNSRFKTLAANTTFTFSNLQDDRDISVELLQDATGTRTVTWPASIVWVNSTNQVTVPSVNTNAGFYSFYHFWRRGGTLYGEGPSTASSVFLVNLDAGLATSSDLAVQITDETGSGSLVFSNAPSISSLTVLNWLNVTGTATNRSTLRQMGGQTNDANLRVVGATELQGSVTNSSWVNTAGGVTNYGAVANLGTVTNSARVDNGGAVSNYTTTALPSLTASRALVLDANKVVATATGTPDGTKFLRDDNTYAVPPGGAGGGSNFLFDTTQFLSIAGGTNIAIKSGALATNVVLTGSNVLSSSLGSTFGLARQLLPGAVFNGTNQSYYTNIGANITIAVTNIYPGVEYSLLVSNAGIFTATLTGISDWPYNAGHAASTLTTNGLTEFVIWRDQNGNTNAATIGQPIVYTPSASVVFTTNSQSIVVLTSPSIANSNGVGTNINFYSGNITSAVQKVNMAGGFSTNAVEVLQGPAVVGAFNSNGVVTMQVSNSATAYPAHYTVFTVTADGSMTNVAVTGTSATNSWFAGATGVGSRTLPANFWQVGRRMDMEMEGAYWTAAANGPNRVMLMLNTPSATNIAAQFLATPPLSVTAGDFFRVKAEMTCRTTGASGTIQASGAVEWYKAGAATVFGFTNNLVTVDTTVANVCDLMSTNGATTFSVQARNGGLILK